MTPTRPVLLGCLLSVVLAVPGAAQTPSLSIRPFVVGTEESFVAVDTFDAVFGRPHGPFLGGGVQVVVLDRYYVEVGASRFRQNGQRALRSGGQVFRLGIPLTATITPLEVTGGYRFRLSPHVLPYVGVGFGSYSYRETSDFSEAGENIDTRHGGLVLHGGAEFRLHRWVGLGADVQYTHVPGILGQGGISQQAGETDLGGVAARFKLIVGR